MVEAPAVEPVEAQEVVLVAAPPPFASMTNLLFFNTATVPAGRVLNQGNGVTISANFTETGGKKAENGCVARLCALMV